MFESWKKSGIEGGKSQLEDSRRVMEKSEKIGMGKDIELMKEKNVLGGETKELENSRKEIRNQFGLEKERDNTAFTVSEIL